MEMEMERDWKFLEMAVESPISVIELINTTF